MGFLSETEVTLAMSRIPKVAVQAAARTGRPATTYVVGNLGIRKGLRGRICDAGPFL